MPISVLGLNDVPAAGELFTVVESEREARAIVDKRQEEASAKSRQPKGAQSLEQVFEAFKAGET